MASSDIAARSTDANPTELGILFSLNVSSVTYMSSMRLLTDKRPGLSQDKILWSAIRGLVCLNPHLEARA